MKHISEKEITDIVSTLVSIGGKVSILAEKYNCKISQDLVYWYTKFYSSRESGAFTQTQNCLRAWGNKYKEFLPTGSLTSGEIRKINDAIVLKGKL